MPSRWAVRPAGNTAALLHHQHVVVCLCVGLKGESLRLVRECRGLEFSGVDALECAGAGGQHTGVQRRRTASVQCVK